MSSSKGQTIQKENEAPVVQSHLQGPPSKGKTKQKENEAPLVQGHSQGLNKFLAPLAGAYDTENKDVIGSAQNALVGALLTEKKIDKKRVEVKKDAQFVEELKGLGLFEEKEKDEK